MNIECPNCETIFEFPSQLKINKKLKCSVCDHIWDYKEDVKKVSMDTVYKISSYKGLAILNAVMFLSAILVILIFRDELSKVDFYWNSLFLFFDDLMPI